MKRRSRTIYWLLSLLLAGVGCNKSSSTPGSATSGAAGAASPERSAITSAPASVSGAPASAAGTEDKNTLNIGASATDVTTAASTESPADTSGPAAAAVPIAASSARDGNVVAADAASPEALRKRAQIEWALKQDEIKNDPNGQWAVQAKASSTYNDAKGNSPYSASQATGSPNIEGYGNSGSAWTPKTPDAGIEWLEVQYRKPVHATAVRVRESYGSGVVMKIEAFDEQGAAHAVWMGADPTKDLDYLVAEFPKTAFKTGRIKLTLATNVVHGANEIDAVQLVGTDE